MTCYTAAPSQAAGEDNRNVARVAALLAGLPESVGGAALDRLCGSGLDAVGTAARAIKAGEQHLLIAGGVESVTCAPFVIGSPPTALFSRSQILEDTTMGWRFVDPKMQAAYGVESMPQTAEDVAAECNISRADQDNSRSPPAKSRRARRRRACLPKRSYRVYSQRKGDALLVNTDEHLRPHTTLEALAKLKPVTRADGSITAGNASGINDGACALLIASETAVQQHGLARKPALSAWPWPGSRHALWATAPWRRCEKCSRKPASRWRKWM